MRKPTVTVRVPATTSNLGPGFDTLGIALKLHNQIAIRETDEPAIERVDALRNNPLAQAMSREAAAAFFSRSKIKPHGAQIEIKGDLPTCGGLGASVTVRLGIIYALNELHGRPLSENVLLEIVAELEGHPDNAAPALFGGFVVAGMIGGGVRYRRFSIPATLKFIVCSPEIEILTDKARAILPKQIPLRDAVENLNRATLMTSVFATGDYALLRDLFTDRLHQPYRLKLLPQLDDVIAAGTEAGALGGWLSGSGSSIICITEQKEKAVADAMSEVFNCAKIRHRTYILHADNDGTRVKRA